MPKDIDLMLLFDRIHKLVQAKAMLSAHGGTVRVKNVVFKTVTAGTHDVLLKEVKVSRRTGFLWLKKEVVFFATKIFRRGRMPDYEILKYVPGEWENLIEETL